MLTARFTWRALDLTTASVIGVSAGVIFWIWGLTWSVFSAPVDALLPGLGAFFAGVWLSAGLLGALIIRKPGAALLTELVAAAVSAALGSQWGLTALWSGFVQGLGAELVFALFAYRLFGARIAVLAGIVAGLAMAANDLIVWYPGSSPLFATVYAVSGALGGAVIAGLGSVALVRSLRRAGALRRFAA
ncbi:MAG TPA: ECF transporter S component [Microbacteriaceae bacterium]|nr:ECF transporter S component [Microbacteriaceae bacterium]